MSDTRTDDAVGFSDDDNYTNANLFAGLDIDTEENETVVDPMETAATGRNHTRTKRQSLGRSSLCDVNTQFITPQAALNNRGIIILILK